MAKHNRKPEGQRITVTLAYKGQTYTFRNPHTYDEPSTTLHMWEDGNYGCDCNKSKFIQRNCDPAFPDMGCGETIALVSVVADDGTQVNPYPQPDTTRRDREDLWVWDSTPGAQLRGVRYAISSSAR